MNITLLALVFCLRSPFFRFLVRAYKRIICVRDARILSSSLFYNHSNITSLYECVCRKEERKDAKKLSIECIQ